MLEQKQRVRLLARQNRALSSLLDLKRRLIIDAAETFDVKSSWQHRVRTACSSGRAKNVKIVAVTTGPP
jgi:hypothetical protein